MAHKASMVVTPSAPAKIITAFYWAGFGLATLSFIIYVAARWVTSSSFKPTSPGTDLLPASTLTLYLWIQITSPIIFMVFLYFWLAKPWLKTGTPSIEGLLTVAWALAFFQDPIMSFFHNTLSYNAYLINFGTWANGSFPFWHARNTQYMAEPIIMGPVAYVVASLAIAVAICAALRRIVRSHPGISNIAIVCLAYVMAVVFDFIWENAMIHGQLYAYPGTIEALSVWAGTQYQFPIYETIFFGANITACVLLLWFRDGNGHTFIERGISQIKNPAAAVAIRTLAAVGFVQASMFFLWIIPMLVMSSIHVDPFPPLPSYLQNKLCQTQSPQDCP